MGSREFVVAIITLHNEARGTSFTLDEFLRWMRGRTVTQVNGTELYYYHDVLNFLVN